METSHLKLKIYFLIQLDNIEFSIYINYSHSTIICECFVYQLLQIQLNIIQDKFTSLLLAPTPKLDYSFRLFLQLTSYHIIRLLLADLIFYHQSVIPRGIPQLYHGMRGLVIAVFILKLLISTFLAEISLTNKAAKFQPYDLAFIFAFLETFTANFMFEISCFFFIILQSLLYLLQFLRQGFSCFLFQIFFKLTELLNNFILMAFDDIFVILILFQLITLSLQFLQLHVSKLELFPQLLHFIRLSWFLFTFAEIKVLVLGFFQIQNQRFYIIDENLIVLSNGDDDLILFLVFVVEAIVFFLLQAQVGGHFFSELGVVQVLVVEQFILAFFLSYIFNFDLFATTFLFHSFLLRYILYLNTHIFLKLGF